MKTSIIIPAHNEEKRISQTISSIYSIFDSSFEVIAVSNNSTDNTPALLRSFEQQYPNFKALVFSEKLGKGGAILQGFRIARGDIIGFLDADDAFDLRQVKALIESFSPHYDCFIASKWKHQKISNISEPFSRKLMSRVWNLLVTLILGLRFADTQGGLKFLRRSAFEKVGDSFIGHGFEFDAELLWRLQSRGYRISEVYIKNKYVQGSTFNTKHIPGMFLNLLRMGWSRLKK